MSKGQGQKIGIKFTRELTGNILGILDQGISGKLAVLNATASSQYSNYSPSNAIDGTISTRWISLDKTGLQYIQVNLGSLKKIEKIKAACGTGYIPEVFNIAYSNDGVIFVDVLTNQTLSTGDVLTEFVFKPIYCQYIRLVMNSNNSTRYEIKELEVHGYNFTLDNRNAFTISFSERKHVKGSIIDKIVKPAYLEAHPTEINSILLTMPADLRFNNTESPISIEYDKTKGNLSGSGGFLENFTYQLTPEDLESKPNPLVEEYFTAEAAANINFTQVTYNSKYDIEHFEVGVTAVIDFIDTRIVNP